MRIEERKQCLEWLAALSENDLQALRDLSWGEGMIEPNPDWCSDQIGPATTRSSQRSSRNFATPKR
jgi:hypothetical protein